MFASGDKERRSDQRREGEKGEEAEKQGSH